MADQGDERHATAPTMYTHIHMYAHIHNYIHIHIYPQVEEWQTKATNAKKMAQQVALALQGQANRKSANIGQERASELKRQLKNLNPDLKLLDGVAAYKEAART